jgi:hypothetical protein
VSPSTSPPRRRLLEPPGWFDHLFDDLRHVDRHVLAAQNLPLQWVAIAYVSLHLLWGAIVLRLRARPYIRQKNLVRVSTNQD